MKRILLFLLLGTTPVLSQSLQSINYNFLYNPDLPHSFEMDFYQQKDSLALIYQLTLKDTLQPISDYTISWEVYESLSAKKGTPLLPKHVPVTATGTISGTFSLNTDSKIIAAKITHTKNKQVWYYFKTIENKPFSNGYILSGRHVLNQYTIIPTTLRIENGEDTSTVFYYDTDFPAATTPFAETQGLVDRTLKPDSIFTISSTFSPQKRGLYLIQSDTAIAKGICLRVEDNYPKYSTLQNLVGPLTYITTKNEYERLCNTHNDKKAFDKIILGITGNAERARIFMRNYFRRVELANRYFTSYKEGWKTDRGMMYIIFGQANFVYKFEDREVWEYKTSTGDTYSFTFVKSASLFDPENYVLVRKRGHQDLWLEAVDLNRNARF